MKAATVVFAGDCNAPLLVLDEPLSFWGGLDTQTGVIIDERHPQRGESLAGRILMMPGTRGSTSAAGALCESLRLGTGPVAFILPEPDVLILTAVTVAAELYGRVTPVVAVDMTAWPELARFGSLKIDAQGNLSSQ
jgi:predicted aconitase with swiveling domain